MLSGLSSKIIKQNKKGQALQPVPIFQNPLFWSINRYSIAGFISPYSYEIFAFISKEMSAHCEIKS